MSDKTMNFARKYIDNDDTYHLQRITDLDIYLKNGITTDVTEFGPVFHDMTLVQYSIAKRKPKALKCMLETSYYQCQVPFDNIISPDESNTKGNILNLAIEFGSINEKYGNGYNEINNDCLIVIIDFAQKLKKEDKVKFDINIENFNGETPLIMAVYHQNEEAAKLLIKNGADLFYACKKNQYLINPLYCLLRNCKGKNVIEGIINDEVLDEESYYKAYQTCKKFKEDDYKKEIEIDRGEGNDKEKFEDEISNPISRSFIEELTEKPEPPKPAVGSKCSECKKTINRKEDIKECKICHKKFCSKCYKNHKHDDDDDDDDDVEEDDDKKLICAKCKNVIDEDDEKMYKGKYYCSKCYGEVNK